MTFKEKYMSEYGNKTDREFRGVEITECPSTMGYESKGKGDAACELLGGDCHKCWEREMKVGESNDI